ncbi:MAG: hypothetical protein JXA52_06245 [Planctomycetes bacterium]|nr:hypothetical protein [Planctomycetota bacterium]
MSGILLADDKITTDGLYLRTRSGVMGPYTVGALRRMAMAGILPSRGAVSVDKKTWRPAGSFREFFDKEFTLPGDYPECYEEDMKKTASKLDDQISTKALTTSEEELRILDELRQILRKVTRRKSLCHLVSTPVVLLCLLAMSGILLYAAAGFSGLLEMFTWKRCWSFLSFAVPAQLGLLAIFSMGGSLLLYKIFGLSKTERHFLALYLQPSAFKKLGWGRFLRGWLLHGDSWFRRAGENPQVYFHVFYHGLPRHDIAGDVNLWEDLTKAVPYSLRSLCLPGGSIRQAQAVTRLPRWSTMLNELTDGHLLKNLLDNNYNRWSQGLLSHARKRLQLSHSTPLNFFLSFIKISEGKEALAVCVYPQQAEPAEDELSTSSELAA